MDNKEIYKKTLGFSIRRLLWDFLSVIIFIACMAVGFLIMENTSNKGLIGLGIGAIFGLIFLVIFSRWISYTYKAGQIAMMTRGIVDKKLPEDVIGEGKKIVKKRFTTVSAYFWITGIIKGIFNELGRAISAIGRAIGGDNGSTVGDVISTVIQVIVSYLCDCCLGWVFYRENVKASKATCEGAVLFFKHGKTFAKNMGRVFGMGILSFLVIGGAFTGIFYLIFNCFPDVFSKLSYEIVEAGVRAGTEVPAFFSDVVALTWICSGIVGVICWSFIHSTFIRPFVLVGVLRNYIESGMKDIPSEKSFGELDEKSKKFKKLHAKLEAKA